MDITINPLPEHSSILHGILGVTPTASLRGSIDFTTKKQLNIRELRLNLLGKIRTQLVIDSKKYTQEIILIQNSTTIIDATVPKVQNFANQKKNCVSLPPGDYTYPFEIPFSEDILSTLPGSFSTNPNSEDEASILYTLTADLMTAKESFFGSVKTTGHGKSIKSTEILDVPRIDQSRINTSDNPASSAQTIINSDNLIDYNIGISTTSFIIDEPIVIEIRHLQTKNKEVGIKKMDCFIRQHCVIRADGQQKTFRHVISVHQNPNDKLSKTTSDGIEFWNGKITLIVERDFLVSNGIFSKKNKKISLPAFESNLVVVHHSLEILCVLKNGKEIRIEVPVNYFDADSETMHHLKTLGKYDYIEE